MSCLWIQLWVDLYVLRHLQSMKPIIHHFSKLASKSVSCEQWWELWDLKMMLPTGELEIWVMQQWSFESLSWMYTWQKGLHCLELMLTDCTCFFTLTDAIWCYTISDTNQLGWQPAWLTMMNAHCAHVWWWDRSSKAAQCQIEIIMSMVNTEWDNLLNSTYMQETAIVNFLSFHRKEPLMLLTNFNIF